MKKHSEGVGMNKKERFLTAVMGDTPDMVPVAPLIADRFAYRLVHKTGWRAVFETHQIVGSIYFRGPTGLGFDMKWPSGWSETSRIIEKTGTRETIENVIRTPMGDLTSKAVCGMIPDDPIVCKTIESPIKSEKDYKIYKAYWEEWLKSSRPNLTDITEAHRIMGDEGVANVGIGSAFSHIVYARGVPDIFIDLYKYPEVVEDLLETLQMVTYKQIDAFMECPSELVYIDAWGAFDLSPSHFKKLVFPELKKVVDRVRENNDKLVGFYMVGKTRALLPIAIEANPHFIEPFEDIGDISLAETKKLYGNKICVMGNFSPMTLAFGSLEEARRETLRCLNEGMSGGGYVLVTSDEVPGNAKLENLKAMVETAEKYGRY
jgi:uroporphyrinogen-III decarboxylase